MRPTNTRHADLQNTAERNLKLHVKEVGRLDWDRVDGVILPELRERYVEAKSCMFNVQKLSDAMASPEVCRRMTSKAWNSEAELLASDVERLMTRGHIQIIGHDQVRGTVRAFTTVEEEKQRRRLITEPVINYYFEDGGEITLATMEDILAPVMEQTMAISLDYPWFYGQMEIPVEARPFYCFMFGGQWYRMVTVATGGRHVPAVAQAITKSISQRAALDVGVTTTAPCGGDVRDDAYVDNVRFTHADVAELRRAHGNWVALSTWAGITVDDEGRTFSPVTDYIFLGVRCIHAKPQTVPAVALAPKALKKIEQWRLRMETPESTTLRTILQIIGQCVWASRVLAIPMAPMYYLFKFVRRRVSMEWSLDAPAEPWRCVGPLLKTWLRMAASTHTRQLAKSENGQWTLFSDSCLSGYGVILMPPPALQYKYTAAVIAGPWRIREHINILEARACKIGVDALPFQNESTSVEIVVDNTALLGSGRKTRSNSYVLNGIVGAIHTSVHERNFMISRWRYIASALNPADAPSRWHERTETSEQLRTEPIATTTQNKQ